MPDNDEPQKPPPASRRPVYGRALPPGQASFSRLPLRLIGIPAVAVAGVLIYVGLRDRLFLPECDSARARNTLAAVFLDLKMTPVHYEPLTTVSSSKSEVSCKATLPLDGGGEVDIAYRFFWDGSKANMNYTVSRRP